MEVINNDRLLCIFSLFLVSICFVSTLLLLHNPDVNPRDESVDRVGGRRHQSRPGSSGS